jgi:hypothetical protein
MKIAISALMIAMMFVMGVGLVADAGEMSAIKNGLDGGNIMIDMGLMGYTFKNKANAYVATLETEVGVDFDTMTRADFEARYGTTTDEEWAAYVEILVWYRAMKDTAVANPLPANDL